MSFRMLTSFLEMLISYSRSTWNLPTEPKLRVTGVVSDHGIAYCWSDLNPSENLCCVVKRRMRDTRPNQTDELRGLYQSKPGLPLHLSSTTGPIDEVMCWMYFRWLALCIVFWLLMCNILFFWDVDFFWIKLSWALGIRFEYLTECTINLCLCI